MDLSDIDAIKQKLKTGDLVLYNKKLYTRAEWDEIEGYTAQVELYDLLQHTKKIQL